MPIPRIASISRNGVVKILWDQSLLASEQLKDYINEFKAIEVKIEWANALPEEEVLLGFELKVFQEKTMKIQLDFSDPLLVSQFSVSIFNF